MHFCCRTGSTPRHPDTLFLFRCGSKRPLPMKFGRQGIASAPIEAAHELFGFLVIEVIAIVSPIRPKAMPVILTMPAEVDRWLVADTPEALALKKPLTASAPGSFVAQLQLLAPVLGRERAAHPRGN